MPAHGFDAARVRSVVGRTARSLALTGGRSLWAPVAVVVVAAAFGPTAVKARGQAPPQTAPQRETFESIADAQIRVAELKAEIGVLRSRMEEERINQMARQRDLETSRMNLVLAQQESSGLLRRAQAQAKELEQRCAELEKEAAALRASLAKQQEQARAPSAGRFNLEFKGGTVGELVEEIRKLSPQANIVVYPEAATIPAPPMSLKNTTVQATLSALPEGEIVVVDEAAGESRRLAIQHNNLPDGGQATVVRAYLDPQASLASVARRLGGGGGGESRPSSLRQPETETLVLSLGGVAAKGVSAEAALSAVEAAMGVFGSSPTITYHAQTSLLIARGSREQLSLLERTVSGIEESAYLFANNPGEIKRLLREKELQIIEAQSAVEVAARTLDAMRKNWADANAAGAKMEPSNLRMAEIEMAKLRGELQVAEARLAMLVEDRNALQKTLQEQEREKKTP